MSRAPRSGAWRGAVCLLAALAATALCRAERLPIRHFTSQEGLAHDTISHIFRCSRGYLWFSTALGLSRFDGRSFVTYGSADGLFDMGLGRTIEDPRGFYWVATWGRGLYRLDPFENDLARAFHNIPIGEDMLSNRVHTVLADRQGRLWAGTIAGLYVSDRADESASFRQVDLRPAGLDAPGFRIRTLLEDREGTLWIGGTEGLLRLTPAGLTQRPVLPDSEVPVHGLMQDRAGRIWVGHERGLTIFVPGDRGGSTGAWFAGATTPIVPGGPMPLPSAPGETWAYDLSRLERTNPVVSSILETSDGSIWWTGTQRGHLFRLQEGEVRVFDPDDGLSEQNSALAEDSEGNLWIGSLIGGAKRLRLGGFHAYGRSDGLDYLGHAIVFDAGSEGTAVHADDRLYRLAGDRFVSIVPRVPRMGWIGIGELQQRVLKDRMGQWWFGTADGVHRFPAGTTTGELERTRPETVYRTDTQGSGESVTVLMEDSRGDVWIGLSPHSLIRWERRTGRLRRYGEAEGLPPAAVRSLVEDRAGNIWVGCFGALARLRGDRAEVFSVEHGLAEGTYTYFYRDDSGRLWITRGGATRVDDPTAERPAFRRYSMEDGLTTNRVSCFTEDRWGRIYIGSVSGIDRLEPDTGRITHFSSADGLSNDDVEWAHRSRDGSLWFAARQGISRLVPALDAPRGPPPGVQIRAVAIAGAPQPLALLGQRAVEGLRVAQAQNRVQVDFGTISFASGRAPRFQYLLEGRGVEWSPPSDVPGVQLAGLAPGSYRLLVRAMDAEGRVSPEPASVSFVVLPPFWRTWWFGAASALLIAGLLVSLHRRRVARVVELERVRTRIATDLHDDVGSSLTQIAILSEVTLRDLKTRGEGAPDRLERIAGISRALVDSMSDIVWSINPAADRLADLLYRMRRFATDLFAAGGVRFRFIAPEAGLGETLDADVRRQAYLVFKESLNNAVRHSGCTEVEIRVLVEHDRLILSVRDNGSGFDPRDPRPENGGQGMESMLHRARRLGGTLHVDSRPGGGTSIELTLPLKRPRGAAGRATMGRGPTNAGGAQRAIGK